MELYSSELKKDMEIKKNTILIKTQKKSAPKLNTSKVTDLTKRKLYVK